MRYFKIRREVDLGKNLVFQTRKEKAQKGSQNETILRRRTGSGREYIEVINDLLPSTSYSGTEGGKITKSNISPRRGPQSGTDTNY